MIWDKIWKRKEKPDDSNSCISNDYYSIYEVYKNYSKKDVDMLMLSPIKQREIYQCEEDEIHNYLKTIEQEYKDIFISFEKDLINSRYWFRVHKFLSNRPVVQVSINCTTKVEDFLYQIRFLCDSVIYELNRPTSSIVYKHLDNNETLVSETPQSHYCTSCGAALKRNSHKCEYCDTEYW